MPGLISAGIQAKGEKEQLGAAEEQLARAEQQRKDALAMGNKLDWSPEMVSKALGSYQRSQSPVADAFIGSFLSGANDQAIQSTRAGAPRAQAAARQTFDQQYGGWDKLRQQDAEMRKSQPWTIKDMGGVTKLSEEDLGAGGDFDYLSKEQLGALEKGGLNLKDGAYESKGSSDVVKQLMDAADPSKGSRLKGDKAQAYMQAVANYMEQGGSTKELEKQLMQLKLGSDKVQLFKTPSVDEFIKKYGNAAPKPTGAK